jgi:hypothetical protein
VATWFEWTGEEIVMATYLTIDTETSPPQSITVQARIAVRPTWVGLLDFVGRLPSPLGGVQEVAS